MNWHLISKEEALQITGSNINGLSESQSAAALLKYGPNELLEKKKKPAWLLFLGQFKDLMILILIGAAIISGIVGDLKDTIVIIVIIFLNAIVGFVQEYRAEKAMEALKKMSAPSATVLRDKVQIQVPAAQIVPGEVIILEAGNMVPADLRLLETFNLRIEEATLTGESQAVEKQTEELSGEQMPLGDRTNMAYKGTLVTYGRGQGVAVGTGMDTEIGQIAQMLQEDEVATPLQSRLTDFSKKLSYAILGICVVIYAAGMIRGEEPVRMLLTAISVAVAAIPEALPAVVTIALALGARRMVRKHVLIRKLSAAETLGAVTYICTDKTGTLTQNKMTVTHTWAPPLAPEGISLEAQDLLMLCMGLNHDVKKNEKHEWVGESTELALVHFVTANPTTLPLKQFPRVAEAPFDSDRKMMTTVHPWADGQFLIITKGAIESVLAVCEDPDEALLTAEAEKMGTEGLRVLAYACRLVAKLPPDADHTVLEQHLQCCGIAGMIDPPRKEAVAAIAHCKSAGIVPVMITGDHPVTATAIARELGIINSDADIMVTGAELEKMTDAQLQQQIEHIKVYARVSPNQKLQIVKALQHNGQYVAMTGDGVNDAPALRRANIGIAMGISGTDVSKQAAHMILLDDNFASIVKAVKEGRRIFDNIRKFIRYILTGNSGEIWTIFLAPLLGLPMPLLPIHILWINLVTDGLPALALAGESADKNIMKIPPRKPGESIFSGGLGWHVLWVGMLMAAVCLSVEAWAVYHHDPKWQTYVFTILCLSQMGHVLAIRSEHFFVFRKGLFSNKPLMGAVLLTFGLQLALIYIPVLHPIFATQSLSLRELIGCGLASIIVFHAVELEKFVRRLRQ